MPLLDLNAPEIHKGMPSAGNGRAPCAIAPRQCTAPLGTGKLAVAAVLASSHHVCVQIPSETRGVKCKSKEIWRPGGRCGLCWCPPAQPSGEAATRAPGSIEIDPRPNQPPPAACRFCHSPAPRRARKPQPSDRRPWEHPLGSWDARCGRETAPTAAKPQKKGTTKRFYRS